MAAVRACGEGAMLSHRSAAALWEIGTEKRGAIDISVTRSCELKRPGLRVHGRPTLAAKDVASLNGIPVTSPVQILVDIATELDAIKVERAVNEADKRDLIDPALFLVGGDDFVRATSVGRDQLSIVATGHNALAVRRAGANAAAWAGDITRARTPVAVMRATVSAGMLSPIDRYGIPVSMLV